MKIRELIHVEEEPFLLDRSSIFAQKKRNFRAHQSTQSLGRTPPHSRIQDEHGHPTTHACLPGSARLPTIDIVNRHSYLTGTVVYPQAAGSIPAGADAAGTSVSHLPGGISSIRSFSTGSDAP